MMLRIPQVLNATQVSECRASLLRAAWTDGRITAGHQSARAKHNLQLPQTDPIARELSLALHDTVLRHPLFFSAALPRTIFPPLFNRYQTGQAFGNHIDNAVRYDNSQQPPQPVRTDLSATLFLSAPDEYDGGELVIEDTFGAQHVKLAAGDLVLYPASSLHRVEPVTRGERLASFFWVQSLVRDAGARRLLFDLDNAIRKLTAEHADHPALIELTGVYHNLLRRWTEI